MSTWRAPSLVCLLLIMVQGCGSGERSAPKSEPDKKRSEQPYLYLNAEYERFLIAARTASWKPPMKKEDLKFEALDTKQAADGKWSATVRLTATYQGKEYETTIEEVPCQEKEGWGLELTEEGSKRLEQGGKVLLKQINEKK